MEIAPISLLRLVDRLCEQRLVERRPHESDRRANRLHLTPKGRAALERMAPLAREISGRALAGFGETEARQLLRRLMRIKDNIRAAAEPEGGRGAANGGRDAG
jgi:MarR family transcriptional regulator for hemolysin